MSNYLKTITIVGASGHVGEPITTSLLAQGKHTVTALTRPSSTSPLPSGLHAIKRVDFSSLPDLAAALAGQDVLIITLSVTTPPDVQLRLIDAAVQAGVRYVMLNEWGIDVNNASLAEDSGAGRSSLPARAHAEKVMKGTGTSWLALVNGSWYEHSLMIPGAFGFEFGERKVTFFDEGKVRICVSTWKRCGEAVARLLALKVKGEGDELTVGEFANGSAYVNSFTVSQSDMFASVLRVTGDTESDWKVEFEASDKRLQRGVEKFKAGEYAAGHVLRLYSRIFYPNGETDYSNKVINEQLGLNKEDLDEATARAVQQAKAGYVYGPR